MNAERFLSSTDLERLVASLTARGTRVFGPVVRNGRCEYRALARPEDLDLRAGMPALPLKPLFLPPSEVLFTWRKQHDDVTLTSAPVSCTPAVVIGARPCDAAGVEILDKVMGWDYRDDSWFARREATTIVALACRERGGDCFCEDLGLGPASAKGADVLLTEVPGGYRTRAITAKGTRLVEQCADCFTPADGGEAVSHAAGEAAAALDLSAIQAWLSSHFEDPIWATLGARCHGCGACASVCPTCHCFDIVDEPDGLLSGTRRRNWDACQSAKFTVHASGHNPRGDQHARFRQRVLHKFSIYPQRFGELLCTGCGRCASACAAGQNLREILGQVATVARGTESETRS